MNMNRKRLCAVVGFRIVPIVAIIALSTTLVLAGPKGTNMKVSATVAAPDMIAVRIRHDMCPLCKALDPKYPEIVREFNGASMLFVTLDLTDETTQKQSALLTGALGLEGVWTGDLSKIGSVTIMDGKNKQIISFVQSVELEPIRAALRKAVDARRG